MQRYDDCLYLPMNHDELYVRFADVWPELLAFIRTGRFTSTANRTPPTGDPLAGDRPSIGLPPQGPSRAGPKPRRHVNGRRR